MKYTIDMGDPATRVALACCACGWRGLATSRPAALQRLAVHEKTWHPDDSNVLQALKKAKTRAKTR